MSTADEPQPLAAFDLVEITFRGNRAAKLLIFADRLRFEVAGEPACELLHGEHRYQSDVYPGLLKVDQSLLVIKEPSKRTFQLTGDVHRAVQGWLGPPTLEDLKLALERRFAWIMPIGVLLVFVSLPLADTPFHPFLCIQGMVLVFIGLLARMAPHRLFFLFDSCWFLVAAVSTTWTVLEEGNWWWLLFVVLQIAMTISGIRQYHRFAPERMAQEGESRISDDESRIINDEHDERNPNGR